MYKDPLDSDGLTFNERCIEREYYYNHLSCMADEEDMSVEDYIIQMATDGRIDDECRKEEYYEE
ncbi:MAG: hypothetical protein WBK46_07170 [Ruminococcus flavefaciens]